MSQQRIIQWLFLAATVLLLMLLKRLHIGVIHYNVFLLILVGWCLGLVIVFRKLTTGRRPDH